MVTAEKNSDHSMAPTFLTPGEKRVGLCFIFILASDHIIKKCFALLREKMIISEF